MSKVGGACLAAMLAMASSPALSQDTADFEDPLAQIRAQIEQVEAGKTSGGAETDQAALASVASGNAEAATPAVKDPLARISERLGLPVLGLVALAGLALLALLLGAMWFVTNIRNRRANKGGDRDLYAVDDGARGRRELPSGTMAKRQATHKVDSRDVAAPTAAAAAAAIISQDDADADPYSDDLAQDDIRTEDFRTDAAASAQTSAEMDTDAADPSSWRRPNLDRLKASIREDWQGGTDAPTDEAMEAGSEMAEEAAATTATADETHTSPLRAESESFADLFGADEPEPAAPDETVSFFSDGLGSSASSDRTMFSDLRSTIEKTADITPSDALEKRRAELPSREDAMRRIKALRESVKAS